MDLNRQRVKSKQHPGYPDAGELNPQRRSFLRKVAGGILGLALVGVESCRTPGEPVRPPGQQTAVPVTAAPSISRDDGNTPPTGPQVEIPPEVPLPGEPMVPPKPEPPAPHMRGDVAEPAPPPPLPEPPKEERDVVQEEDAEVREGDERRIKTGGVAPREDPVW